MPNVFKLEKVTIGFEHFLQVAVAELSHNIDLSKIFQGLMFGNNDIDHLYDIGMFTVFK